MVATVLRLRYRALGNTLARRPWQLVGFCFGALWALSFLVLVAVALGFTGATQSREVIATAAVVAGSALLLGWLLGPLLLAGMESTVDAQRLAPFPLRRGELMLALGAVGLTGIPGIMTLVGALASVSLWVRWPAAAVAAVPCALLAVVTCVAATQLMWTLSSARGGGRRGREIAGTVVLVLLILSGPIITGILSLLQATGDLATRFVTAGVVLGWTPLGAAWSVPAAVAEGAWLVAGAKLVIAAATPIVLLWLWSRALDAAVASPPRRTVRAVASGRIGLFGAFPSGGVGATWARSLTAWLRDPRYLRQLLVVPLFPVLFAFAGGTDGWLFGACAVLVALVLAIAGYADISYDGTAFASVLSTGIRGRDDRLGRLLGAACLGVPLLVIVAVATTAVAGTWPQFPALLGAALGVLLTGYGVTAVSSALIVTPVAAAGDSPFRSVPGQTFVNSLLVFVVWGACLVLASPSLVLAIIAVATSSPALGWTALTVGVLAGSVVAVAGVLVGGRTLERTGPDLLARIKAFPV
jgi:ABC-2 type transport system permease protein